MHNEWNTEKYKLIVDILEYIDSRNHIICIDDKKILPVCPEAIDILYNKLDSINVYIWKNHINTNVNMMDTILLDCTEYGVMQNYTSTLLTFLVAYRTETELLNPFNVNINTNELFTLTSDITNHLLLDININNGYFDIRLNSLIDMLFDKKDVDNCYYLKNIDFFWNKNTVYNYDHIKYNVYWIGLWENFYKRMWQANEKYNASNLDNLCSSFNMMNMD